MRYRRLHNGDYVFGNDGCPFPEFYVNQPEAVAQAVQTRLLLFTGEWFLDTTEGTPYSTAILGKGTQAIYDGAIKSRILGTPGVSALLAYGSELDTNTRGLLVSATIMTVYSQNPVVIPGTVIGGTALPNIDPFGNLLPNFTVDQ